MNDKPLFSIIMAAYNAAATIGASIESVLAQTRSDWELIVVDDGSVDATVERVADYSDPRIRLLRQANLGVGAARNAGIAAAQGDYLSILDSDDLWLPGYLDVMAETFERSPEAAVAYTDAWVFDERSGRVLRTTAMASGRPPEPPPQDPSEFFLELLERNFVYVSATIRRTVLDAVGAYDHSPVGCEDYELSLRVSAAGYRIVRAPGRLAVYRLRHGSLSSDRRRMSEGRRIVYRLATTYELPAPARHAVRDRLERYEREVAAIERKPFSRLIASVRERVGARLFWRRYAFAELPDPVRPVLADAVRQSEAGKGPLGVDSNRRPARRRGV